MQYGNKKIKDVRFGSKNVIKAFYGSKLVWEKEKEIISPILPDDVVDLGLPSGTLWCTHNVGASAPEESGNYYQWGETKTAPDNNYVEDNCAVCDKSVEELLSLGYIDENNNLTPQYDAAIANLGENWRMPTKEECQELVDNCSWEWTTQNGVKGSKVTGPNGNSIFLPAAGDRLNKAASNYGSLGRYWNTKLSSKNSAYTLTTMFLFNSFSAGVSSINVVYGFPIRPVYKPEEGGGKMIEFTMIHTTIRNNTIIDEREYSYQAEEGMTWSEWCESEYNTTSFRVDDNKVYSSYYLYLYLNDEYVYGTDVIQSTQYSYYVYENYDGQ